MNKINKLFKKTSQKPSIGPVIVVMSWAPSHRRHSRIKANKFVQKGKLFYDQNDLTLSPKEAEAYSYTLSWTMDLSMFTNYPKKGKLKVFRLLFSQFPYHLSMSALKGLLGQSLYGDCARWWLLPLLFHWSITSRVFSAKSSTYYVYNIIISTSLF